MTDESTQDEFTARQIENIRTAVVEHGHAFQQRAIFEADLASYQSGSNWTLEVQEFPVCADRDTRIDAIFTSGAKHLIVECKRANPAFSTWLFARAPLQVRHRKFDYLILDGIERKATGAREMKASAHIASTPKVWPYQISFEVRTDKVGNIVGKGNDKIEEAVRQAIRGANGFINYRIEHEPSMNYGDTNYVIPAVFTTADLVVTDIDFSEKVKLDDGHVAAEDLEPYRVEWVFLEYHAEPTLRHKLSRQLYARTLPETLDRQYVRTVPIVSSRAIGKFLSFFSPQLAKEIPTKA